IRKAKEAAFDYYSFIRNAYLQRRVGLINDEEAPSSGAQEDLYHPEEAPSSGAQEDLYHPEEN
ncbi:MAG TPA: hypothetical protein VLF14_04470, partial [Candidatus Binatia bacterium]|nr:hypothetical protein [Candidatus Binatia bacterium]